MGSIALLKDKEVLVSCFKLFAIGLLSSTVLLAQPPGGGLPGGTPPVILGTEVNFDTTACSNPCDGTVLISGRNLGNAVQTVQLFVPALGDTILTVLNFDAAAQTILTELPQGIANTPGTFLLTISVGPAPTDTATFNLAIGAVGPTGPPGEGALNPLQVALKRWHQATSAPLVLQVGDRAFGLAFDGDHIWAAYGFGTSGFDNFVAKIRASDGSILLNLPLQNASKLTFDGLHIWATRFFFSAVTKIRASDGQILGTFSAGVRPRRKVFDGENIWIANDPDFNPGAQSVIKMAGNGSILDSIPLNDQPVAVTFDGESVWVSRLEGGVVTKIRALDSAVLGDFLVGDGPTDILFDGEHVWVAVSRENRVVKLQTSDGSQAGSFPVGQNPQALAFDGNNIWVANFGDDSLTKLRATDGSVLATVPTGDAPTELAFDGANIWVANQQDGTVRKH